MNEKSQTGQGQVKQNKINLEKVEHALVVMSGKGGVGKSTVSANLAASLAEKTDKNIGVLDADIHGPNIPKILGVEDQLLSGSENRIEPAKLNNLRVMSMAFTLPDKDSPVIWRGPLKMKAIRQFLNDVNWGGLEYLIIDLPPGTGDEALSIAQLLENLDGSIIVTTPQDLSLLDSRKSVNFSKKLDMPVIGIIENMSGFICPHCGEKTEIFKSGGGKKAAGELGVNFLGTVPLDHRIVQTGDDGVPFVQQYPGSEAAKAFAGVVERFEEYINRS
ncbi:MAG: Mrp/NBP35 family ATP-binding protein [Candidatus Acetothermia bacterium]|nr:Mrp/NBP35 family ATP-binding protein [Candidatus Bipolaricaulota bacterium]